MRPLPEYLEPPKIHRSAQRVNYANGLVANGWGARLLDDGLHYATRGRVRDAPGHGGGAGGTVLPGTGLRQYRPDQSGQPVAVVRDDPALRAGARRRRWNGAGAARW